MTAGHPYQIELQGRLSDETLKPYMYEFVVSRTDHSTVLAGLVRDPSHLQGIVAHMTNLGIDIVGITAAGRQDP